VAPLARCWLVEWEGISAPLALQLAQRRTALLASQLLELVEGVRLFDVAALLGLEPIEDRLEGTDVPALIRGLPVQLGELVGVLAARSRSASSGVRFGLRPS